MSRSASSGESRSALNEEQILALFGFLRKGLGEIESAIQGTSMERAVPHGSRIRIRLASASDLEIGQVVAYASNDRIVAHRLVKMARTRAGRFVITRGDDTCICDAPVPDSGVVGVLTEFELGEGWRPVPEASPFPAASRLMAGAAAGLVLAALRLDPGFSVWVARRLFEARKFALKAGSLAKRRLQLLLIPGAVSAAMLGGGVFPGC